MWRFKRSFLRLVVFVAAAALICFALASPRGALTPTSTSSTATTTASSAASRDQDVETIVHNFRRATRAPASDDVTLYTQLSVRPHGRLGVMRALVRRWNGPASVTVYIMDTAEVDVVAALYDKDEMLRTHLSLHLVFMRPSLRTDKTFLRYGIQMVYPINVLRNVAIVNAKSDWLCHVDADFSLTPGDHAFYRRAVAAEVALGALPLRTAFVLPAFEMHPRELPGPRSKRKLRSMYEDKNSTMSSFAEALCPNCHGATNYRRFFRAKRSYTVAYQHMYEPYTIVPRGAPTYDEALIGRHLNKNLHIWDLHCRNYTFRVLPNAWVLHTNVHKIIPYIRSDYDRSERRWREHQVGLITPAFVNRYLPCNPLNLYSFLSYLILPYLTLSGGRASVRGGRCAAARAQRRGRAGGARRRRSRGTRQRAERLPRLVQEEEVEVHGENVLCTR
jgi:hypothetical protein